MTSRVPEIATVTNADQAAVVDGEEPSQLSLLAQEPVLGEIKRGSEVANKIGRPKGSMNRRTKELAAYILSRHRNPVEAAAEIVDTPIADLAVALKCDLLEAFDQWRKCAEFVARYTLQTMPQSVNLNTPLAGYLTVINLSAPKPGEELALSSYGLDLEIKGNQGLSETDQDASPRMDAKPLNSLDS